MITTKAFRLTLIGVLCVRKRRKMKPNKLLHKGVDRTLNGSIRWILIFILTYYSDEFQLQKLLVVILFIVFPSSLAKLCIDQILYNNAKGIIWIVVQLDITRKFIDFLQLKRCKMVFLAVVESKVWGDDPMKFWSNTFVIPRRLRMEIKLHISNTCQSKQGYSVFQIDIKI